VFVPGPRAERERQRVHSVMAHDEAQQDTIATPVATVEQP
jgi:hypothetical protein